MQHLWWRNWWINRKKYRLMGIESFVSGTSRCYVGIFEYGSGHYFYNLQGWDNFIKKWKELGKKNYRLVDIETYVHGGKRYYIGVWLPGRDGYYLWSLKGYASFKTKFYEMQRKGYKLVDLEVIY